MNSPEQSQTITGKWWHPAGKNRVICTLCPRYCNIPNGSHGFCYIRKNKDGRLLASAYGTSTGFASDPVEKKPLYHFYPGTSVLSFGTVGCNLGCKFCQNWHISKSRGSASVTKHYSPNYIIDLALAQGCTGIAYTYNDPIIFGEWVIDIAREAKSAGLMNILVSNGYVSPDAREEIYGVADAINIDLKSYSNDFYRRLTLSSIDPVIDTLHWLAKSQVWFEITMLIIPGENDSRDEIDRLTRFIAEELGQDIPLHLSAFHPAFRMMKHSPTPEYTMNQAYAIARENGLNHVYIGNLSSAHGQNTYCSNCNHTLIERRSYKTDIIDLDNGKCGQCGEKVPGYFKR